MLIKMKITLLVLLIGITLQCEGKKTEAKKSDSIAGGSIYSTDNSSFDPKTGEFIKDQFTNAIWHLNEGKDIILLENNTNADLAGALNRATWTDGRFGRGLKFDGKQSYVQFEVDPEQNKLLIPANALSIEMWILIEPEQFFSFPAIISKDITTTSSGNPTYEIYINNQVDNEYGYNICFRISTTGGEHTLPANFEWRKLIGKWHYFAATYNGQEMCFYIDGKLENKRPASGQFGSNEKPLRLARKYLENSNLFHGSLDEIRISNVARSEKAIKEYWEAVKN